MHFRGTLNHVEFFLDSTPSHLTAVPHSDEQATSIAVGERAQCFGNFVGVVDAQLEVLLLMLSFLNHAQDVRHEVKVGRKGQIAYFCPGKT